jgi:hypothetical protein
VLSARTLPRRRFFDDMPDKGLFVIMAMVGFSTIVTAKVYQYNADLVAAWAVSLMLFYGVVAYRMPLVRLRLDRLGDNFYYLGFIFTLASLSAALLQLRAGTPIETLLGSFGIALATTIIGVAGRVMFVQMRGEIDEIEAQVRRDLLAASEELRGQMAVTLREFQTFHTGILQASSETQAASLAMAKHQIEGIGSVAEVAAGQIAGLFETHRVQVEEISAAVARTGQTVEQMIAKVARMELPSERLEEQLMRLDREIEMMLKRLRHMIDTVGRGRRWYWPFGR